VTQADLDHGSVNDVATATGTSPAGTTVQAQAPAAVTATAAPAITLVETAAESFVDSVGDVIHYTFHVTNTGNVTLHNLTVTDAQVAPAGAASAVDCGGVTTLAAGASVDCTATYTVTQADLDNGSVNDTATATGTPPSGPPAQAQSSASVPISQSAAITVLKSARETSVSTPGDVIHYTFHVTNTGNVTVHNITVTDTQHAPAGKLSTGPSCPTSTLASGQSMNCTGTYTVTQADIDHGSVADVATTTADPPQGTPIAYRTANLTVRAHQPPHVRLALTGPPLLDELGGAFALLATGSLLLLTGVRRRA
jgi:uncharacterized repeat protein (TIGR01451 family)